MSLFPVPQSLLQFMDSRFTVFSVTDIADKLVGERYLRGRVGFTSSETDGTAFYGVFPLDLAGLH